METVVLHHLGHPAVALVEQLVVWIPEEPVVEETEPATQSAAAAIASPAGPVQIKTSVVPSSNTASKTSDKDYAGDASNVVTKSNKVAENALADSSANVQSSVAAQVKRTANIWIWFVLVALILGIVTFIVLRRDKKSRYQKYASKKKSVRAQLNSKW